MTPVHIWKVGKDIGKRNAGKDKRKTAGKDAGK